MKKYLLIPDSFKGSISSSRACTIMSRAILNHEPDANIISIPVADGGEGSVNAFLNAVGGKKYCTSVKGPFFNEINSFFGVLNDNKTVVIEMAACSGLTRAGETPDPTKTTTYGAGQLIKRAIELGSSQIIMALGDSATNDGGCGAASAMGAKFYNAAGYEFIPVGGTLKDIARIDLSDLNNLIRDINITAMCDINNPLYGKNGAAYIFAPQKGADPKTVELLDKGLRHLETIVKRDLSCDNAFKPGVGAAGGMGYGMISFFNARLRMGIEVVLDAVRFSNMLSDADYVFTGEGKIDSQSLLGKVVIGVARRAKEKDVPVIAFVGDIGDNVDAAYSEGVTAIFSINRVAVSLKTALSRAENDLYLTVDNFIRLAKKMHI
ncbi:MAG: glycerate kinase [Clostridia bacterium]